MCIRNWRAGLLTLMPNHHHGKGLFLISLSLRQNWISCSMSLLSIQSNVVFFVCSPPGSPAMPYFCTPWPPACPMTACIPCPSVSPAWPVPPCQHPHFGRIPLAPTLHPRTQAKQGSSARTGEGRHGQADGREHGHVMPRYQELLARHPVSRRHSQNRQHVSVGSPTRPPTWHQL